MKFKTVLFDLDGTLLNTLGDLTDCVNYTLRTFGRHEVDSDRVRMSLGYGADYLLSHCLDKGMDDPEFEQIMETYVPYYEAHSEIKTAPYDGIPELIQALNAAGCKCAIISNKPDGATRRLGELHFHGQFETAQGEKEGIRPKPAPDAVIAAMERLGGTREDSVYVGDSEVDVRTAKNTGIPVIGVEWGFRDHALLEMEGADYIVSTPKEIEKIILS